MTRLRFLNTRIGELTSLQNFGLGLAEKNIAHWPNLSPALDGSDAANNKLFFLNPDHVRSISDIPRRSPVTFSDGHQLVTGTSEGLESVLVEIDGANKVWKITSREAAGTPTANETSSALSTVAACEE